MQSIDESLGTFPPTPVPPPHCNKLQEDWYKAIKESLEQEYRNRTLGGTILKKIKKNSFILCNIQNKGK